MFLKKEEGNLREHSMEIAKIYLLQEKEAVKEDVWENVPRGALFAKMKWCRNCYGMEVNMSVDEQA